MPAAARLSAILAEANARSHRSIVTPEGVALPVELAARSERAAAFLIDLLVISACFIALGLLALAAGLIGSRSSVDRGIAMWVWIALLFGWFVVRSFYFALFELRWQGSTPGKRVFHLRVVDRAGGALTADAVIARNLMREVEVFLPTTLIAVGVASGADGLIELAMLGWMLILTFMPLFNRDRLRVGDMVGGTWVITAPKATLLPDLAENGSQRPSPQQAAPAYLFSSEQLDAYGIYELQTLEQVLRQDGPNAAGVREEVAKRIQRKISWTPPLGLQVDARAFLQAFYTAQRGRLEAQVLLGRRRKDKHDRAANGRG